MARDAADFGSVPKYRSARNRARLSCRNRKSFDLFFDFVSESRCARTVYDPMIESKRKRNDLCSLVLVLVGNQFAVRGTDEKCAY